MVGTVTTVDADTRRQVVENIAAALDKYYVFPEVAQTMGEGLQASLAEGAYDELTTPAALCERLTADLQAISRDKHIRVRYSSEPRLLGGPEGEDSPEETALWIALARSVNFGFYKVERLAGNVGYLDLRNFWEAEYPGAGETAVGAMNLLAHTDALIVDLRRNGGGSPSMVALLTSFLFKAQPVHLNSFYQREGDTTTQTWTLPYIPGPRTPDKPVYVLTSNRTFSAAEEFTYNLKNLKRATIIGETTGGGANPGGDISVTPHFRVFVPTGRAINPITSTNWEGTGVEPDIQVSQEDALNEAYRRALEAVIEKLGVARSDASVAQVEEARAALTALGE
ncbi:MAG TPA: S41 family peptidase [Chloroflexia bacterium]|jgi:C-terminal processing protease CtpA/Prc